METFQSVRKPTTAPQNAAVVFSNHPEPTGRLLVTGKRSSTANRLFFTLLMNIFKSKPYFFLNTHLKLVLDR